MKKHTVFNIIGIFSLFGLLVAACGRADIVPTPEIFPANESAPDVTNTPPAIPQTISYISASAFSTDLQGLTLDDFFAESYKQMLLRSPQLVTEYTLAEEYGIGNDQLDNISYAYLRETQELEKAILDVLLSYERESLSLEQRVSYDVYAWYLDDRIRGHEFMFNDYPVAHFIIGEQIWLVQFFTEIHPVTSLKDAEDYVTRLSQVDTKFEQLIEGLEQRKQAGVVLPRFIIDWSLGSVYNIARSGATFTPFYESFEDKLKEVDSISLSERQELLQSAEDAITDSVVPAYYSLAQYLEDLKSYATTDEGVWKFSNGEAYYNYILSHHTTTDITAEEIHQLGLDEVARIRAEMRVLFDELGYPADENLPRLFQRVADDSGYLQAGEVVEGYESIIEAATQNLGDAFDLLPSAELIVVGGQSGGYYIPPAKDGSRPGAFYAAAFSREPKFSMPTLAYHEAVPGHHFQLALAQEMGLPSFRTEGVFTSYAEGWALYAERLAWELGFYEGDPYGNLGRLQGEIFRAVRLVVDTGIHAESWTYAEGVAYMVENTGMPRGQIEFEVSRYIAWPGQATAYKIGMLKILELRQLAMDELGDDFVLKEFHNVVLGSGSVPLSVLEALVKDYIAVVLAGG